MKLRARTQRRCEWSDVRLEGAPGRVAVCCCCQRRRSCRGMIDPDDGYCMQDGQLWVCERCWRADAPSEETFLEEQERVREHRRYRPAPNVVPLRKPQASGVYLEATRPLPSSQGRGLS